MSVDPEEVVQLLMDVRARYAALAAEVATLKATLGAESSPADFNAYFVKHGELGRQELRRSLLEKWAADQGVEVPA